MKTIFFILLLTATIYTKVDGCSSKCLTCETEGTENQKCTLCYKSKPKAMADPNQAVTDCTGTATIGALVENSTNPVACDMSGTTKYYFDSNACTEIPATVTTVSTNCVQSTFATPNYSCTACINSQKPKAAAETEIGCEALGTGEGVTNCMAHSSATACQGCKEGFVLNSAGGNSCAAETTDNKGCLLTACDVCNYWNGYYMTSTTNPKCSKSSSFAKIVGAISMIAALFFANF